MTTWIGPDTEGYDDQRALFNAMIDKRPRLIAGCASAADVREALDRAARDGLAVAVRSAGHSVAGQSSNDDGLVVDVRPMTGIEVDVAARRARVGGGCTWGELDAATQQHGLATTGGRVSSTGVTGLTLGGGSGWLERQHGLACDNLLAVELVTADGREIRADESQHQDLLWASRGGGGNFGVVTALELRLHPVGPTILGGLLLWPFDRGAEVARAFRDWADAAPDELGTGLVVISGPPEEFVPAHLQGQPVVAVVVCWNGDHAKGQELVQVMRDLAPEVDLVGPMPYVQLQSMLDDPPGLRQYWSADYHDSFPDGALDVFLEAGARRPSPMTQHLLLPWGGALARVDVDATPLSQRSARWVSHPFATWEDAAADDANIAWVREYRRANAPFTTGGVYLNFIGDEGDERIKAAFGAEKYERLSQIKGEYDPGNVFVGNQNIRPRATV
ncbi:FAD-binding oxidoreductase [Nocardioides daeguensis]|uniref:FAD-binding oxidoreductase n=1 Tax=Nocardioides daeguensis TaxID=908359 RepID=A0ABP6UT70_9ACTN|nr:FAD-binding oxidoreductase [Nocardioides daeguensis]MBV6728282.1 FAD-binding oxidoreductase [Nocardioides daeguensis]MCR1773091.1 FAD-binding oxidoreductase [Nocardioides daeguensis]